MKRFLSEKGIILFYSHNIEEAETYLDTAYRLGYRESSLLFYLARVKRENGNTKRADVLLKEILKKSRRNIKALAELGNLKMELKEYKAAISIYTQALKIVRNEPLFYNNIGVCYQRLGDIEKANTFFEHALNINTDYIPAKKNLEKLDSQKEKDKS